MTDVEVLPQLKQIVGSLLFGATHPLSVADIRRVLRQAAENGKAATREWGEAKEADIRTAVEAFREELEARNLGFKLVEVAQGYRLVSDAACGPWLRTLLRRGRPTRLSQPALETLAIIAYRQPCTRAEIEAVRGVDVDQLVRNLLELQLVRLVGRSELPGRPWLLGTTQKFMEHFGLNRLDDLPGIAELRRMEEEQIRKQEEKASEEPGAAVEPAEEAAPVAGNEEEQSADAAEKGED